MNYKTEKLPNEPITIWTGYEGFAWGSAEEKQLDDELRALWSASREPIYHIADMSFMSLNLEEMMQAAAAVAFGEQALYNHPNLRLAVIVTQDPVIVQGANNMIQSMDSDKSPYHQVPMIVMESVEQALAYIRSQIR